MGISRREFACKSAQVMVLGATATLGILASRPLADTYVPTGYLDCDSIGAMDVAFVTLDGVRVDHVARLNDVDGWLEHYDAASIGNGNLRICHRRGDVRVAWRKS